MLQALTLEMNLKQPLKQHRKDFQINERRKDGWFQLAG